MFSRLRNIERTANAINRRATTRRRRRVSEPLRQFPVLHAKGRRIRREETDWVGLILGSMFFVAALISVVMVVSMLTQ